MTELSASEIMNENSLTGSVREGLVREQDLNDVAIFWCLNTETGELSLQLPDDSIYSHLRSHNDNGITDFYLFIHPADRDIVKNQISKIKNGGQPKIIFFRLIDDDQLYHWITATINSPLNLKDEPVIHGTMSDARQLYCHPAVRNMLDDLLLKLAMVSWSSSHEFTAFMKKILHDTTVILNVEYVNVCFFSEKYDAVTTLMPQNLVNPLSQFSCNNRTFTDDEIQQLTSFGSVIWDDYCCHGQEPYRFLFVPIVDSGKLTGVLTFCVEGHSRYFSWDERHFCKSIAKLIQRNVKLMHHELQHMKYVQMEATLTEINNALAAETGADYFHRFVALIAEKLHCDWVCVAVHHDQTLARTLALYDGGEISSGDIMDFADSPLTEYKFNDVVVIREGAWQRYSNPVIRERKIEGMVGIPLFSGNGKLLGGFGMCFKQPKTEQYLEKMILKLFSGRLSAEIDRQKREQELSLLAITFETNEGIIITDAQFKVLRVNKAFCRITGFCDQDVLGCDVNQLNPKHVQAGTSVTERLRGTDRWSGEDWFYRKSGEQYPQRETITAVRDVMGNITHYVVCFEDISERKSAEEKIKNLAFFDALTGLPNRRLLNNTIATKFQEAKDSDVVGALLFIDLDYFKTINDSLGHAAGDSVLEQVAKRLRGMTRHDDFLARLGGDEFVLLLPNLSENPLHAEQHANLIGQQIIEALSKPYCYNNQFLHIGASVGVSMYPSKKQNAEDLLKQADTAMYQAKSQGRKAVAFFNSKMQRRADKRLHIHNRLQSAIENNELFLHYQPQHMVQTNEVIGVEALVRWYLDGTQMISPGEFIPVAEETDLIIDIGKWVLREACTQFIKWQQKGIFLPQISVNLSTKQFHDENFVDMVLEVLEETGMDPMQLNLEITESIVLEHAEDAIRKMTYLKNIGISFAVDDFGAGYSSLSYLKRLPASELKIDRSFIQDIPHNPSDMAIVEAVLAMAKHIGFNVTAEGVESRQQLEFLQRQQCSFYQGFFASKPLASEYFEAYIKRQK